MPENIDHCSFTHLTQEGQCIGCLSDQEILAIIAYALCSQLAQGEDCSDASAIKLLAKDWMDLSPHLQLQLFATILIDIAIQNGDLDGFDEVTSTQEVCTLRCLTWNDLVGIILYYFCKLANACWVQRIQ